MTPSKERTGFTLVELLLTISIIGVLSTIVIVAVNPLKQLSGARDAGRKVAVNQLEKAMFQHLITQGDYPATNIPVGIGSKLPICRYGQTHSGICINIDPLTTTYMACIPYDGAESDSRFTGYEIYQDAGRVQVVATYLEADAAEGGGCEGP